MIVLRGNERLAGSIPEHERVEGGQQQAARRIAAPVGLAGRAGGVESSARLRDRK